MKEAMMVMHRLSALINQLRSAGSGAFAAILLLSILLPSGIASMIYGTSASRLSAQDSTRDAGVSGVIREWGSGNPLANVVVKLGARTARTDSDGRYSFQSIPAGRYWMLSLKDGYLRGRPIGYTAVEAQGFPVSVREGEAVGLDLWMFPASSVAGRVLDFQGKFVRNVRVIPYRLTYDDSGNWAPVPVESVDAPPDERHVKGGQSDDRGAFRIYNLEPGQYIFYIQPAFPFAPVYYPGVTSVRDAAVLEIEAGVEARLDTLTLFPESGRAQLLVDVINETHFPTARVVVEARRAGTKESFAVRSGLVTGSGTLSLGDLPPGAYDVEAWIASFAPPLFLASRSTTHVHGSDTRIRLAVTRGATLTGRATSLQSTGESLSVPGIEVRLASKEVRPGSTFSIISGEDGVFTALSIPEGLYQVSGISGLPGGTCLEGISQSAREPREVLNEGLLVTHPQVDLTVRLRSDLGAIRGYAVDGEGRPISGTFVALVPDRRESLESYRRTMADQYGNFEIACVLPGAYRIYAWRDVHGEAHRNADFIAHYLSSGNTVSVGYGETAEINVVSLQE